MRKHKRKYGPLVREGNGNLVAIGPNATALGVFGQKPVRASFDAGATDRCVSTRRKRSDSRKGSFMKLPKRKES